MFSVVIPVWNEEAWLPGLLAQLAGEDHVSDVIVADNASQDESAEIARRAGCTVLPGGRPGEARNRGAAVASENLLVFIDADAVLPNGLFLRLLDIFADAKVGAVHFPLVPVTRSKMLRAAYALMNSYFAGLQRLGVAQGVGTLIAVRAAAFRQIGGFDVRISAGEDADFLRRLHQGAGAVVFDRSMTVGVSARRFEIERPLVFAGKTTMWALLRLAGLRISIANYRWRQYPMDLAREDAARLAEFRMGADDTQCHGSAPCDGDRP